MTPTQLAPGGQFDWSDKAAIRAMVARAEAKGWIKRPIWPDLQKAIDAVAEERRHRGQRMRVSPYHHPEPVLSKEDLEVLATIRQPGVKITITP